MLDNHLVDTIFSIILKGWFVLDDKGIGLADFEKLRKKLESFKNVNVPELELAPIEKWMIKELGVERIKTGKGTKKGKGSRISYRHDALRQTGRDGIFGIDIIHGRRKGREMVKRTDFRGFLYRRLLEIIAILEQESRDVS